MFIILRKKTHVFDSGHLHILYHYSYTHLAAYKHLHSDTLDHIQLKKQETSDAKYFNDFLRWNTPV